MEPTEVAPVTPDVTAVDTAGDPTPGPTQDAAPVVEPLPPAEDSAETPSVVPPEVPPEPEAAKEPVGEWAGELDAIEKQDWYSAIPEDKREVVKNGMSEIYKGWQRSYTKKNQALADERKAFQAERDSERERFEKFSRDERTRLTRIMYGDDDPVASARTEWEAEKKLMQEGYTKAEAEWKAKHDALKGEYETPLEELKAKHAALEGEHNAYKTKTETERTETQKRVLVSVIENFKEKPDDYVNQSGFFPRLLETYPMDEETSTLYTEALMNYVTKNAKDLVGDDKLWESLWKRITDLDYSINEAIEYTRERAGKTQPPTPAELAMSNGAPSPERTIRPNEDENAFAYLERQGVI